LSGEDLEAAMALMNLAATQVAASSPPRGSVSHATTARRPSTWYRTMLETVGTFLVLAGIAVGILTLRLALVLIHGVMH
jgi:hypothetical protein